jgi:glyoxylase-like metal-dependent hydrolase (beta-lactamase superfamily II)
MKIITIQHTPFKATGINMFGTTPAEDWERLYPVSENGKCTWALRSLLIEHDSNLILIDTGFGNYNEQLLNEYEVNNYKNTVEIIKESGYNARKITHVIHTHLHVDHCGGSFVLNKNNELIPQFENAQYIVSSAQFNQAQSPTDFEKDSFDNNTIDAFANYKNKKLIESEFFLFPWLELLIFNGHTKGLLIPVIHTKKQSIAFAGDLIPSVAHLTLKSTMSYDVNQLLSLSGRENFLEDAFDNDYILFFQHDKLYECCSLKKENGQIVPDKFLYLNDVM